MIGWSQPTMPIKRNQVPPTRLFHFLSLCLSFCTSVSVSLVCLSVCLSVFQSLCLCLTVFVSIVFQYLCLCLTVFVSILQSFCLSAFQPLCLCLSVSLYTHLKYFFGLSLRILSGILLICVFQSYPKKSKSYKHYSGITFSCLF